MQRCTDATSSTKTLDKRGISRSALFIRNMDTSYVGKEQHEFVLHVVTLVSDFIFAVF